MLYFIIMFCLSYAAFKTGLYCGQQTSNFTINYLQQTNEHLTNALLQQENILSFEEQIKLLENKNQE